MRAVAVLAATVLTTGSALAGTAPARAAGTSSSTIKAPYSARSRAELTCDPGTNPVLPPTCNTPVLSSNSNSGVMSIGSSSAPFSVVSPGGGSLTTDGYGDAVAGLTMFHKVTSTVSSLRTTFTFKVPAGASVTYAGAGSETALSVEGQTYASCVGCDAATPSVFLNSLNGTTSTTADQTLVVVVDMTPSSGSISKNTTVGVSAILVAGVNFSQVRGPWYGAGTAYGSAVLTGVTFSA